MAGPGADQSCPKLSSGGPARGTLPVWCQAQLRCSAVLVGAGVELPSTKVERNNHNVQKLDPSSALLPAEVLSGDGTLSSCLLRFPISDNRLQWRSEL